MGKKLLVDVDSVFNYTKTDDGVVFKGNPGGRNFLNKFMGLVYGRMNLGAVARYEYPPFEIESGEQFDYLKFFIHLGMVSHSTNDHMRISGEQYYVHPLQALLASAKHGVSVFALAPIAIHDVEEELVANPPLSLSEKYLRTQKGKQDYYAMSSAIMLGMGYLAYQFVHDVFPHPERFHPSVSSAIRVFHNMTRRMNEDYFSNLRRIYKGEQKDYPLRWDAAPFQKGLYTYLKEFFDIGNTKDFKNFINNVYFYVPKGGKSEKAAWARKNQRRAMMAELADSYSNVHELKGLPMKKKGKIIAKSNVIVNITHESINYFRPPQKEEWFALNRIMEQCIELERELAKKGGIISQVIDEIVRDMRDSGNSESDIQAVRGQVDMDLIDYKNSPFFNERTSREGEQDTSIFAGTIDDYVAVINGEKEEIFPEDDPVAQLRFFRLMQEQFTAYLLDEQRFVKGFTEY